MQKWHLRPKLEAQGPRIVIDSIFGRFEPPASLATKILKAKPKHGSGGLGTKHGRGG